MRELKMLYGMVFFSLQWLVLGFLKIVYLFLFSNEKVQGCGVFLGKKSYDFCDFFLSYFLVSQFCLKDFGDFVYNIFRKVKY